ncbi:MAG TPA: aspartate carbamoyltransferase regulatory subunit [Methanocorpusculum sp.]|nr:aspartate carbamoyltransferase regulatory subunit [Methanocorpusculum sp.]
MKHLDISQGIVISPIKNGTVIDHITAGQGLVVLRILGLLKGSTTRFTLACNVVSSRGGQKDLVKIEDRELSKEEVDRIALIAPNATISIIRDFKIAEKKSVEIPAEIRGVITCPNPNCITNTKEPVESRFVSHPRGYRCVYCDAVITRDMDFAEFI